MELKIKKGLDLPIVGAVPPEAVNEPQPVASPVVAIIPDDFDGFIPKVDVQPGDTVMAGSPLMHHKALPQVKLVSPVAGTVKAVVRGERRKVLRVEIEADAKATGYAAMPTAGKDRMEVADLLAQSGLLAMMRQRPYFIVPDPSKSPRDIFVTAFDSAPLALTEAYTDAQAQIMAAGVQLLKKLTDGDVYISRRAGQMPDVAGAVMVDVAGPHPAGLAGVQIANIKPVNKGESVWTLTADTLMKVGQLAQTGTIDWTMTVAVTGSCVKQPYVAKALPGTAIEAFVGGKCSCVDKKGNERHMRIISGNVLTGVKVDKDGYLHAPYTQITVIPEGDDVNEFMGWASMSPSHMSTSPSYPGHWLKRLFNPDARILGGRRAMIMSGLYDKVMPMDIVPEYLIKAINAGDIDKMERLGIYEVAPEDFALAEYVDSSKQPLQAIVRNGLNLMRKETE